MKTVTDDPDWAPELYEARALAMRFVRKHGRWQRDPEMIRVAERGGLRIIFHPHRAPRLLTIDTAGKSLERVLALEWNDGDAWRVAIETYRSGRWESRLRSLAHPRPWLERWRAMAMFTASA